FVGHRRRPRPRPGVRRSGRPRAGSDPCRGGDRRLAPPDPLRRRAARVGVAATTPRSTDAGQTPSSAAAAPTSLAGRSVDGVGGLGSATLAPGVEKARFVRSMFDTIAARYDLMNRLMTGGQDEGWRRLAADAVFPETVRRAVDIGAGTGDLSLALARS